MKLITTITLLLTPLTFAAVLPTSTQGSDIVRNDGILTRSVLNLYSRLITRGGPKLHHCGDSDFMAPYPTCNAGGQLSASTASAALLGSMAIGLVML
ncbi:uncharacterized protein BP5553_02896 [Venustampulla echinocandica]|uniref:Uncharacterized protein n=1 Tax=Venustampulla echinocandica TaxID=2656787 RepID=A0A370TSP9_9HELO|nr:uncharacterized protein BP5553_02896 [Venustampulla echinocandica]RDL38556.1 hypothetical protein BP5553_02896 [Venustampulla echinocandica]